MKSPHPPLGQEAHRAGFVAVIGQPNVGKSSLINALVADKVSIVSNKPHTTRYAVRGIVSDSVTQWVFVDTPGFQVRTQRLHQQMRGEIDQALAGVDAVVWVLDALQMQKGNQYLQAIKNTMPLLAGCPCLFAINKVDALPSRNHALPLLQTLAKHHPEYEMVPVSALKKHNLTALLQLTRRHLPEAPALFDESQYTDQSMRFWAAEIVREKCFHYLNQELPYGVAVVVDRYELVDAITYVEAVILVERDNHKAMVIGRHGEQLKRIGSEARHDLEHRLQGKVHLQLWVKAAANWQQSDDWLRQMRMGSSGSSPGQALAITDIKKLSDEMQATWISPES